MVCRAEAAQGFNPAESGALSVSFASAFWPNKAGALRRVCFPFAFYPPAWQPRVHFHFSIRFRHSTSAVRFVCVATRAWGTHRGTPLRLAGRNHSSERFVLARRPRARARASVVHPFVLVGQARVTAATRVERGPSGQCILCARRGQKMRNGPGAAVKNCASVHSHRQINIISVHPSQANELHPLAPSAPRPSTPS